MDEKTGVEVKGQKNLTCAVGLPNILATKRLSAA